MSAADSADSYNSCIIRIIRLTAGLSLVDTTTSRKSIVIVSLLLDYSRSRSL